MAAVASGNQLFRAADSCRARVAVAFAPEAAIGANEAR